MDKRPTDYQPQQVKRYSFNGPRTTGLLNRSSGNESFKMMPSVADASSNDSGSAGSSTFSA